MAPLLVADKIRAATTLPNGPVVVDQQNAIIVVGSDAGDSKMSRTFRTAAPEIGETYVAPTPAIHGDELDQRREQRYVSRNNLAFS